MTKTTGRKICDALRQVRQQIADANGISYHPHPCDLQGECLGTCPACEAETRQLEDTLRAKWGSSFATRVAGVAVAMSAAIAPVAAHSAGSEPVLAQHAVAQQDSTKVDDHQVFGRIDYFAPEFPGGDIALRDFITEHAVYPESLVDQKIEGRVVVQFLVKTDGTIGEIKVARNLHPVLDQAAVDIVRQMPKFAPARRAGNTADWWYTVPINFKLPAAE